LKTHTGIYDVGSLSLNLSLYLGKYGCLVGVFNIVKDLMSFIDRLVIVFSLALALLFSGSLVASLDFLCTCTRAAFQFLDCRVLFDVHCSPVFTARSNSLSFWAILPGVSPDSSPSIEETGRIQSLTFINKDRVF
jgi:hypothetical protein